jgi:uncharacterized membrane protein (DUF4010 family)
MAWSETLTPFLAALGLGLLNGVIRERRHGSDGDIAGIRTHALVAVGVVCACLLYAKQPLKRFSQELVSERELQDALMLAAAALVVLPLLPQGALDPWGVLKPHTLWRIVVLVMAVGMLGHVALRAAGVRWGLPIAGFFSGFASSTATVAAMGHRGRTDPRMVAPAAAAAAALLANIASLLLFGAVIGAASPDLLYALKWPLLGGVLGLAAVVAACLWRADWLEESGADAHTAPAFKLSHALALAGLIASVSLVSAWLRQLYGDTGVVVAAVVVALAEIHAAAASIAQVNAAGGMGPHVAAWGLAGALAASVVAKTVLALFSGGVRYGLLVLAGLTGMLLSMAGVMAVWPIHAA